MSDLLTPTLTTFTTSDKAVDPYFVWGLLTDFAGFRSIDPGKTQLHFLVEKSDGAFATLTHTANDVRKKLHDNKKIVRWQLGERRNAIGKIVLPPTSVGEGPEKASVVVALLDHDIPLFHPAYRDAANVSRVRWFWHQDMKPHKPWQHPIHPGYGAELRPTQINNISSFTSEKQAYTKIGYLLDALERSHGASVLSQIASRFSPGEWLNASPPKLDATPSFPLICVQFPPNEVADTSGGWLGARVFDGLQYALHRARYGFLHPNGVNTPVPVVANISYGGLAGPHDGTSMLERAFDYLQNRNRHLSIVLPAGNAHDKGVHAVQSGQSITFDLLVPIDHTRPTFVECWFADVHATGNTQVELIAPDGVVTCRFKGFGEAVAGDRSNCAVLCRRVPQGLHGTMLLVAINPTRKSATLPAAKSGIWKISLKGYGSEVHAWVERDDSFGTIGRAQQSRFIGSAVNESMTLSNIATGTRARRFTVGSIRANDISVSEYSADCLTRATRVWPDLSGVADRCSAARGVMCEGTRSGVRYFASGTSIAAGIATRYLAAQFLTAPSYSVPPIVVRTSRRGLPIPPY